MAHPAKKKGAFPQHPTVKVPTDQTLAESYLELLRLRKQVRVAQCGRAIAVASTNNNEPSFIRS
jgi:hypothetical protein